MRAFARFVPIVRIASRPGRRTGVLGPPGQGLDAHRARPRVEVEHAGAPTAGPRLENSPSRARSDSGRVPSGTGASRSPFASPAMIRIEP